MLRYAQRRLVKPRGLIVIAALRSARQTASESLRRSIQIASINRRLLIKISLFATPFGGVGADSAIARISCNRAIAVSTTGIRALTRVSRFSSESRTRRSREDPMKLTLKLTSPNVAVTSNQSNRLLQTRAPNPRVQESRVHDRT